ncbi:MAG: LysM peptidoglycan-binding domain-containing protein [Anaerolineae bacterium]|nr:LysM peptidoglycan-binding domain-containing protein [Anaerolineae bacterium]
MFRTIGKLMVAVILVLGSIGIGAIFSYHGSSGDEDTSLALSEPVLSESMQSEPDQASEPDALPDSLVVPVTVIPAENRSVILATVTPPPSATPTLLPPPTFEPPTATPTPPQVPSVTPTPTTSINVSIPGLNGAESPTPTSTPGCEPREDWALTYTVQFDDALSAIADRYGVWVDELAEGNCITDKNLITVGQVLRVPGDAHPYVPEVECVAWEVMTPFNGSVTVPADGTITFNWRGPLAPINLIRIFLPDGSTYERVIELRQNETINLNDFLAQAGTYTWYVYPLDRGFQQIDCIEGGPWTFTKPISSTPTPTAAAGSTSSGGGF